MKNYGGGRRQKWWECGKFNAAHSLGKYKYSLLLHRDKIHLQKNKSQKLGEKAFIRYLELQRNQLAYRKQLPSLSKSVVGRVSRPTSTPHHSRQLLSQSREMAQHQRLNAALL